LEYPKEMTDIFGIEVAQVGVDAGPAYGASILAAVSGRFFDRNADFVEDMLQ
jgi:hypothetical protein